MRPTLGGGATNSHLFSRLVFSFWQRRHCFRSSPHLGFLQLYLYLLQASEVLKRLLSVLLYFPRGYRVQLQAPKLRPRLVHVTNHI